MSAPSKRLHPTLFAAMQRKRALEGRQRTPEARAARNAEIDDLYEHAGWTLQQIGDKFGVTRERIRQLRAARGRTMDQRYAGDEGAAVTAFWAAVRDPSVLRYSEAARRGQTAGDINRHRWRQLAAHLPTDPALARLFRWRQDRVYLDRLRRFGVALGHTPTANELIAGGWLNPRPPNPTLLQNRFGSLRNAQRRAGLVPNPRGRTREFRASRAVQL